MVSPIATKHSNSSEWWSGTMNRRFDYEMILVFAEDKGPETFNVAYAWIGPFLPKAKKSRLLLLLVAKENNDLWHFNLGLVVFFSPRFFFHSWEDIISSWCCLFLMPSSWFATKIPWFAKMPRVFFRQDRWPLFLCCALGILILEECHEKHTKKRSTLLRSETPA